MLNVPRPLALQAGSFDYMVYTWEIAVNLLIVQYSFRVADTDLEKGGGTHTQPFQISRFLAGFYIINSPLIHLLISLLFIFPALCLPSTNCLSTTVHPELFHQHNLWRVFLRPLPVVHSQWSEKARPENGVCLPPPL